MPPVPVGVVSRLVSNSGSVLVDESVRQEVATVRTHRGAWFIEDSGLITIDGPDAAQFLQNQSTNDILALAVGQGQASALLDRKAQVLSTFWVFRQAPETFWLVLPKALTESTIALLERVHFSEKLSITEQSTTVGFLALQGARLVPWLLEITPKLPSSWQTDYQITPIATPVSGHILSVTLTGETGAILIFEASQKATILKWVEASGLPMISEVAQTILRVEAGIPAYSIDYDSETMLPATGLEQHRVSYTKGCFPGQEVVAKVKTYGAVQKALVGLQFDATLSELPSSGSAIYLDETPIGELRSTVLSPTLGAPIAMAFLSKTHRLPGNQLTLTIDGKQYAVVVQFLPFYQPVSQTQKAKALYEKALEQFTHDQEEQAIGLLREALVLDPHFEDAYESLGVILSRSNQYEEAIALMRRLAELAPDAVMPHTNLSVFYMKQGLKEEAETEKAIATTLSFKKAMANKLAKRPEQEDNAAKEAALKQKMAMFEEVLELDPEDHLATYGLGSAYLELKNPEAAKPLLEKAISLNPKHSVGYVALAKTLIDLNQIQVAQTVLENGIAVSAQRGDLMPMQEMQRLLGELT